MKTLLYCQHSLGIGHLMRTLLLAEALVEAGPVCLVSGGAMPAALYIDPRIRLVELPALQMHSDGSLRSTDGGAVASVLAARAECARAIARNFSADCVIVEMFPFGRKKFAHEIISLIESARRVGRPVVFSSVRDILVTQRRDQATHDRRAADQINRYFDAVLVHSDPSLIRLEETFSAYDDLRVPVYYTGYVARAHDRRGSEPRENLIVVSAGGGRVGRALIDTALQASDTIFAATGWRSLLLTGSLEAGRPDAAAQHAAARLERSVPDLAALLARSAVSVSQCGYNTATDILASGVPSIVVPYETESEDEQLRRADLLSRRGRIRMIRQNELSPGVLVEAVTHLPLSRHPHSFQLDGARFVADLLTRRHQVA